MATESTVRLLFLGDTAQAVRSVSRLEGAMGGLSRAAKLATGALAVGLIGGLAASTKAAIDFQKQMELIQTQAGASAKEVDTMSKALLKLAPAVGTTPSDLAKGLFHVESAGLRGGKALEVLAAAAKGARVGQANLEDVTNALVGAFKSGIKGAGDMEHAMGVLNATVGAGNMRMTDLTGALGTGLLSKANAVGLSIQDVGAAMAELTVQGQHSTDAATRLSMAFLTMAAPTGKKASDALMSIGLTANSLANDMRQRGLIPALEDLKTHLDDSGKSAVQQTQILAAVFGRRSLQGLLPLIQHLGDLKAREDQINRTTGDFGKAWEATQKTVAFQLERAKAAIASAAIPIGDLLLPLVGKLAGAVASVAGGLDQIVHAANNKVRFQLVVEGFDDAKAKLLGVTQTFNIGAGLTATHHTAGLAQKLNQSFQDAVGKVNWGEVGKKVEAGFATAFVLGNQAISALVSSLLVGVQQHISQIADVGAQIMVTIFTKLIDPNFWISHWQLALGVGVAVATIFTGGLGKLGEAAGALFVKLFGATLGRLLLALFERLPSELTGPILAVGDKLGAFLETGFGKALSRLANDIEGGIVIVFEKLPNIIQLAFKVGAVLTFIDVVLRLVGILENGFNAAISGLKSAFNAFWKWMVDKALNAALAVVDPFSHLPSFLGGWARKAKDAINAQLDLIHPAQVKMQVSGGRFTETITDRHGHKDTIQGSLAVPVGPFGQVFPGKAGGGRISGGVPNADSVPAMLAPGEFVVTGGGERMLESMTFPGVLNWLQGAQPRHFATGGFVQGVGSSMSKDVSAAVTPMAKSGGLLSELLANVFSSVAAVGPSGPVPSGSVKSWLTKALQITGAFSPLNLSDLFQQTMHESGGNPRAINLWDSNAKAGHPSKGLLQTIDSTFRSYMLPGHGNIWNPIDNAIAASRYMAARYGSIDAATRQRGFRGYRFGGRVGPVQLFAAGGRVRKPRKVSHYKPRSVGTLLQGAADPNQPELENLSQIIAHIARLEDDKSFLDQEYGDMSGRFDNLDYGQSFVTQDTSGADVVNQPFVDQRISELNQLIAERDKLRQKMIEQREEYARGIALLIKAIAALQKRLAAAIKKINAENEEISKLNDLIYAEENKKKQKIKTADQWVTSVSESKDAKGKITRHVSRHLKKGGTKEVGGPDQDKLRAWRHRIGELSHERTQQRSLVNTIKGQLSGDNTQLKGWQHDYRFLPLDIQGIENDMGGLNNDLRDLGSPAAIFKKFGTGTTAGAAAAAASPATDPALAAALAEIARLNLALGIQGAQVQILGSFQTGTLQVPETGPYVLHAGESVTPSGVARGGDGGSIGNVHVHVELTGDAKGLENFVKVNAVSVFDEIGRKIGVAASDRLRANRF